jgi:L-2-hydroxycarboxylate dehydrogenase (NAD+)
MKGNDYVKGRSQIQNVKVIIEDVLGHGNERCMLPGQPEARWGALSKQHNGLLFTKAEIEELNHLAHEVGEAAWNLTEFKSVQV